MSVPRKDLSKGVADALPTIQWRKVQSNGVRGISTVRYHSAFLGTESKATGREDQCSALAKL